MLTPTLSRRGPATDVLIAGEPFGSWSTVIPLEETEDGFKYTHEVPAGTYRFKFIVDGRWETSAIYPVDTDVAKNKNNVITIREADWPFIWRLSGEQCDLREGVWDQARDAVDSKVCT